MGGFRTRSVVAGAPRPGRRLAKCSRGPVDRAVGSSGDRLHAGGFFAMTLGRSALAVLIAVVVQAFRPAGLGGAKAPHYNRSRCVPLVSLATLFLLYVGVSAGQLRAEVT